MSVQGSGFRVSGFGFRVSDSEFRAPGVGFRVGTARGPHGLWRVPTGGVRNASIYMGTSLIRNNPLLGPYSRTMRRAISWSEGVGRFLMGEVPM